MADQGYHGQPDLTAFLRQLDTRLSALERTRTIPMGTTTPSTTPADGAMQGDTTGPYLWLRVGAAWKRTPVLV